VLAERSGLRIHEVPVDWIDDPDSRVDIVATAIGDLKGVGRLIRDQFNGQLLRFCAIGAVSTLAYLAVYSLLRLSMSATLANSLALLSTAVANTAANRSYTFGVHGKANRFRHQLRGLVAFVLGLAITSAALAMLHRSDPRAGRATELVILVAANLVATFVRFVLFKRWVFSYQVARPATAASHGKEL
jgi:putative flippase GtrA